MSAACTADGQHVHDATAPNRNAAVQYWYVERYEYDGDDDDIYNLDIYIIRGSSTRGLYNFYTTYVVAVFFYTSVHYTLYTIQI